MKKPKSALPSSVWTPGTWCMSHSLVLMQYGPVDQTSMEAMWGRQLSNNCLVDKQICMQIVPHGGGLAFLYRMQWWRVLLTSPLMNLRAEWWTASGGFGVAAQACVFFFFKMPQWVVFSTMQQEADYIPTEKSQCFSWLGPWRKPLIILNGIYVQLFSRSIMLPLFTLCVP